MKKFSNKQVISRFHVLAFLFTLAGVGIIAKAAYVMFVQRNYWEAVSDRFVRENVTVQPTRGNIFSADGQLLSTSLPEYKIYLDFVAVNRNMVRQQKSQVKRDSLLDAKMDSLCIGLNRVLPGKSVGWYRERIEEGRKRRSRNWLIYPNRISFIDYKEVKNLPFLNLSSNESGFHVEEFNECKKPFGSLAARTIGDLYPGKDSARSGLQLAYDTLLRGKPGIVHRQKVRNRFLPIVDVPPVEGADIVTTLDVKMQDFCEKAIVDKLKEVNGKVGVVILMEVKTGDVKAIVNMTRCEDGQYREVRNNAVSNLMEPGSVFKPMSFMVAFEDNKIKMTDCIDVEGGVKMMYGRKMKDHNWRRGGYHTLTVPECLEYSSNVGVSGLIDRYYHNQPEKFVNGLYKIGIAEDLHLDIPGYTPPRIRRPRKDGSNWSNTALAWMSIGYESQVPPISVLNFYNGVANNGRMMRPRFVTAAMRNGEVIHEYSPQVVREQMCSPRALKDIQTCLEWVVSKGLGKKAGSKNFSVSGKTGTAQVWAGGGFSLDYLVSFAGYFPSEAPQYSCIVCIQKHGIPASGGLQCGPVFHEISEMTMSGRMMPNLEQAVDTLHPLMPLIDYGNLLYANKVLEDVGISKTINWAETNPKKTIWGRAVTTNRAVQLKADVMNPELVPDMKGMGARDAVYLLEKMGLRVRMNGFGIVTQQSLPQGHHIVKGETIMLRLEMKGYDDENFEMTGASDTLKAKSATSAVQTDTMLAKRKVENGKSGQEKQDSEKFVPEKKKPGDNKEKLTAKKEVVHQTDENKITTKAKNVTAKKKESSDKESSVVEQKKAKSSSEKNTSKAEKGKKESTKDKTSKSKNN